MQQNHIPFSTAGGRSKLWIAEVDETKRSIRMERSTGKITWELDYNILEDIHNRIHQGELTLEPYLIDVIIPTWGNYITGLLRYLGCKKD